MGSRKPKVWEWLLCSGILAVGIGLTGIFAFASIYGTTPEEELTEVEGVPTDIRVTSDSGRSGNTAYFLNFTVAGHRTEYASTSPNYEKVLAAVKSGDQVHVWVSTKQETLFPRKGWVPLYKMSVGAKPILSYSEIVEHKVDGSVALLLIGCLVVGVGPSGILFCFLYYRRYAASTGAQP